MAGLSDVASQHVVEETVYRLSDGAEVPMRFTDQGCEDERGIYRGVMEVNGQTFISQWVSPSGPDHAARYAHDEEVLRAAGYTVEKPNVAFKSSVTVTEELINRLRSHPRGTIVEPTTGLKTPDALILGGSVLEALLDRIEELESDLAGAL